MKLKTTLILLTIVIALALFIKFYESKQPNTEEAKRQAQNVLNFDREKLDGILIQNGDDKIELRRRDNKWRLETPIKDQADNGAVANLLSDLEMWQKDDTIGAKEIEMQKKGDYWEIVKPLRARGDDQKIGDLLAQVTTARIEQFVGNDRGDLHPYGLAEPRGTITVFAQDDKQGQMLQIGGIPEKQKDQVYVRFSARNAVYTLPKKIEEILNTKPNDLRDRHLVRFETNILDRITIEASGQGKTVLARKNESWTIANRNNQPANSDEVHRLIDTLKNEQVTKFVADVASELAKYGLDKPPLQITLSSFASENTAETNAGERPFATIAFGKVDGDNVYVRLGDEPFIVTLKRAFLDHIFADPLQWQDLAIFRFKPEQVHRLNLVTDHEE